MSGSPYYASPEMLSNKGYNEKTDIWSIGIIFHYLLIGCFPFDGKTDLEIMHLIQKHDINFVGKKYKGVDYNALMLLKKLLTKDPNTRISASEARQDDFFNFDELD